jgi:methionyl-tRNA formyltransferase
MASLVFLGTPEPAVPSLEALVAAGHRVEAVVTRPDRRRGRGGATSPSPVKAAAAELGLEVTHRLADVADTGAELGVVVAYGRLIPASLLEVLPMINVHFSLLPRWRGAAPVERAILAGDSVTGVCVMGLEEGLDTGPLYACQQVGIAEDETLSHLRGRLADLGARLVTEVLAGYPPLPPATPQRGEATYAEKLDPAELEVHWDRPALDLVRLIRLERAWCRFRGRRLRLLHAKAVAADGALPPPGTLDHRGVAAVDGFVVLGEVQPEGGRPVDFAAWRRGARLKEGERLE